MAVELKKFQSDAVESLTAKLEVLLARPGSGQLCVFQSPTGSGKTLMLAKVIDRLARERGRELTFLWVSIGKGNLHAQSKRALDKVFAGFPKVALAEDEIGGERLELETNEVLVVNWEKVRAQREGEWSNLIMREGEYPNFREILDNTRQKRGIVVIIDESHASASTKRAKELRELFQAKVIVEMSATPVLQKTVESLLDHEDYDFYRVKPTEVIDQGLIRKEILINPDLGAPLSAVEADSQTVVLQAAFARRADLAQRYMSVGTQINPLILVQLPPGQDGLDKRASVEAFFHSHGLSAANGKLKVWFADEKSDNLEDVPDIQDQTEVLVFKQAIDTGWDAPRAQILVRLRDVKSIVFAIQTVGRILRMPEQKHYADEELNRGYVYTNLSEFEVKPEEYNPNIIKDLYSKRITTYANITLPSIYRSRVDFGDVRADFAAVFSETADQYFGTTPSDLFDINVGKVESKGVKVGNLELRDVLIANATWATEEFDKGIDLEGVDAVYQRAEVDVQAAFNSFIRENLGEFAPKRSIPPVARAIYSWFRRLGSRIWSSEQLAIQKIVLFDGNRTILTTVLRRALDGYSNLRRATLQLKKRESEQRYIFEIPEVSRFNRHVFEHAQCQNYAHKPCCLERGRRAPERSLEEELTRATGVEWWWKNGKGGREFLGIGYDYQDLPATFYPDYIVRFKDGRIGVFELKPPNDLEGSTRTKAKAEALHEWVRSSQRSDLAGGIVIQRYGTWYLHDGPEYNWHRTQQNDWREWITFSLN